MSEHRVQLSWEKGEAPFTYETYPRNHVVSFKDGQERLTASASPTYRGDGSKADPEDMLVAALSSCHMLSFLAIAAKKRLTVHSYEDDAVGFNGECLRARRFVVGGVDVAVFEDDIRGRLRALRRRDENGKEKQTGCYKQGFHFRLVFF